MDETEARAIMDRAITVVEDGFKGDEHLCVIVIALTGQQTCHRYASNMDSNDACDVMMDMVQSIQLENDQGDHGIPN